MRSLNDTQFHTSQLNISNDSTTLLVQDLHEWKTYCLTSHLKASFNKLQVMELYKKRVMKHQKVNIIKQLYTVHSTQRFLRYINYQH